LCSSNSLMIGMHRAACPKPQSKGATNILILSLTVYIFSLSMKPYLRRRLRKEE
jgi:hypothetical protein